MTYPVQVYTQLIPPYTPFAPAYYSGFQEKLKVTLINSDMQQPLLSVYLRMRITSSIFSINTPDEVFTPPIQLQAGVPLQISSSDLAPYFQQNNMRISGGQAQFYRTRMFPDNFYRFNFEVYDVNTRRLLSNPRVGFAQAMITAGDPPRLNLPKKGEVIVESNIPNILFTWTPRHMTSVAAAYGTEYEISLAEIYDKQTSPENAFQYSRILYTEHTRSTSFIHTLAQPLLISGMRYAWRVRAVAREGLEDANVFKNEGYSEIFWFDYAADCAPVQQTVAAVEKKSVLITWIPTKAIEYTVEYRKKGSSRWYPGPVSGNESRLYGLEPGITYEYRIGSRCVANDVLNYSALKSFTMPDKPERNPECGLLPEVNLSNRTPAEELLPSMPIFVGDFPVFISTVTGNNGRFSGTGYVGIPFLGLLKVAVVFNNIFVNNDLHLVEGFIEVKYDENGKSMMIDVDELLTGGKGVGDIRSGEEKAAYMTNYSINPNVPIEIKETTIDNLSDEIKNSMGYNTSDGQNGSATVYVITVEDSDGNKHDIVVDALPAMVTDKDGNMYEINEKGEMLEVLTFENPQEGGNNTTIDEKKAKEKVNTLLDSLIINIKTKLQNSDDQMFQLAYKNTGNLKNIVTFDINVGSGGQHINKKISIGRATVIEGENTDGSDGDIMATIFHEYMHYVCFISNIYPKRYQYTIEEGIVYTENIPTGEEMEDNSTFIDRAYRTFLLTKYNVDYDKYINYPDDYKQLSESQRKEVDEYIKENNLSPQKKVVNYPYSPSNYAKDELNAHKKTLEASSLGLFTFSQKKLNFYDKELKRYQEKYDNCVNIERNYNYTPEGYKK
ncbi:hypothetical protein FACS189432_08010 [Bacteroidia bacterium]|nr:hypothetical protein FACS189432_08010 [Bacteroidia bacterium]